MRVLVRFQTLTDEKNHWCGMSHRIEVEGDRLGGDGKSGAMGLLEDPRGYDHLAAVF